VGQEKARRDFYYAVKHIHNDEELELTASDFGEDMLEEVGHILLHGGIIDRMTSTEEAARLVNEPGYEDLDRNARWFASALLMPPAELARDARTIYADLVRTRGFADPEGVKRDLLKALSRRYQVPPAAMRYRLMHWPIKIVDALAKALRERSDGLE